MQLTGRELAWCAQGLGPSPAQHTPTPPTYTEEQVKGHPGDQPTRGWFRKPGVWLGLHLSEASQVVLREPKIAPGETRGWLGVDALPAWQLIPIHSPKNSHTPAKHGVAHL